MSNKVFVGGLAWTTTDQSLQAAFANFGEIVESKVITDRDTGQSRGFGFVTYTDAAAAKASVAAMNGKDLDGRALRVDLANDKPGGSRGDGGGGRGFGNRRY
jgi:RNA recognition motif-containing protein